MTHAAALAWCAALHPDADVPAEGCPGTLRLHGSVPAASLGLADGTEVATLVCEGCGAELAIGRATNPLAGAIAPGLHGLLLWVARPGEDRFDYVEPDFADLAWSGATAPGRMLAREPGTGAVLLGLTGAEVAGVEAELAELGRIRREVAELSGRLEAAAGRQAESLRWLGRLLRHNPQS